MNWLDSMACPLHSMDDFILTDVQIDSLSHVVKIIKYFIFSFRLAKLIF